MTLRTKKFLLIGLVLGIGIVYFFSNPHGNSPYDQTFRNAEGFLHGSLGFRTTPPAWIEYAPFEGHSFSAFPLGAVVVMIPAAILKSIHLIEKFPSRFILAFITVVSALFFYQITGTFRISNHKRILLTLTLFFGTWMWTNLAFGGSWQISLGFAVMGQLGAIYFILVKPHPFIAGVFFAIAFGNRTEILFVAPLFLYLVYRGNERHWPAVLYFLGAPALLLLSTAGYNFARFHSVFDFGYSHIPGVLNEPWYRHGIFSLHAIPTNIHQMLLQGWNLKDNFPYFIPTGFGGSILLSSPFLFLLCRSREKQGTLTYISWIAISILASILCIHGNPGGWQFSYRYAMILLPWMFLIILDNSPGKLSFSEIFLFVLSICINAYATYLFLWTNLVHP